MKLHGIGQGALLLDSAPAALNEQLAALARKRGYAVYTIAGAVAAQTSIVEVSNPAASGKTIYFYAGLVWPGSGGTINLLLDGTTISPIGTATNLYAGGAVGVAKWGSSSQASTTGTLVIGGPTIGGGAAFLLPAGFWAAIPPGHNLQVQGGAVNFAFGVNLSWIELST